MNKEIVLYTTGCPQCKVLKQMLDKAGVTYGNCSDIDVMMELGISSVPMLKVDGEMMNFQKAMQWTKEVAHEN